MKNILKPAVAICALLSFTPAYSAEAPKAPAAMPVLNASMDMPAGAYKLDPAHTSLLFKLNHLGLSGYTARFTKVSADLQFDPKKAEASNLSVTVDTASLQTDFPFPKPDFDAELTGDKWLDAKKFPQITYRSTKIELSGNNTGKVTGDLTLHGITKPVVLDVTFHGGYKSIPMDPSGDTRIGFSARGTLKRSDFGVAFGVPQAGSTLGVGDDVEIIIETEFTKPNKK